MSISIEWYNKSMIRVIAGGKKSKNWVLDGQNEYFRRLHKPFDAKIEYWDDEKIQNLEKNWPFGVAEYVIILDERGKNITSLELSEIIATQFLHSKSVVIIIGGPYGISEIIRNKADFVWSISKSVFPHELMRVILAEQIYRAQDIYRGGKYHHL